MYHFQEMEADRMRAEADGLAVNLKASSANVTRSTGTPDRRRVGAERTGVSALNIENCLPTCVTNKPLDI